MKKQLSSSLLALSLFGFNLLPATASTNTINPNATASNEWCIEIPWMGIFCWEL
ncbi:hypothetical protein NIES4102_16720 [Chondrocystis sp. NIES-4102]|nr:hypothetical protein NIES4102_16720 [Chondrocystis sp. NIES-4102]